MEPFTHYGFASLEKPMSFHIYQKWIEKGYHGDMSYLAKHTSLKENPQKLLPQALSAIVVAQNYLPHPKKRTTQPLAHLRTALYAQGDDYHHWFKSDLNQVCNLLKVDLPNEEFLSFTDSSPVLERDLAHKAGLGWVGKNTCLINKKHGSLFFLGEIYTSLNLEPILTKHPDLCGNCTRCIDACPTQAIIEPREIDARKCISYLNIESKNMNPHPLHKKMKDWFFGCDICQTVCPWNEKVFGQALKPKSFSKEKNKEPLIQDLKWILLSSNKFLRKKLQHTALSRSGAIGLKRNALIIITNLQLYELTEEVSKYSNHERLGELAQTCLKELQKNTSYSKLTQVPKNED